jgi:hypothetical protein
VILMHDEREPVGQNKFFVGNIEVQLLSKHEPSGPR